MYIYTYIDIYICTYLHIYICTYILIYHTTSTEREPLPAWLLDLNRQGAWTFIFGVLVSPFYA